MADVKTQVKTLKVELKTWEHAFLSEHQRKPQKDDIVQDKTIGMCFTCCFMCACAHY